MRLLTTTVALLVLIAALEARLAEAQRGALEPLLADRVVLCLGESFTRSA